MPLILFILYGGCELVIRLFHNFNSYIILSWVFECLIEVVVSRRYIKVDYTEIALDICMIWYRRFYTANLITDFFRFYFNIILKKMLEKLICTYRQYLYFLTKLLSFVGGAPNSEVPQVKHE